MTNFIPESEIRKDIEIIKGAPNIKIKREIGEKYGCPKNMCSKWQNIYIYILEYLREIRKTKSNFTDDDVHDFYVLTNYNSRYDKLKPYLNLESGIFIKFLLDFEYNYLLNKRIKQYTLDNIDNITIGNDITHGSSQIKFYLERYKTIKKYYDEEYGIKKEQAQITNKNLTDLYTKIIEDTYEMRMDLEQNLENFISYCYETYIYNDENYKKIKKMLNHYADLVIQKIDNYPDRFHYIPDEEHKQYSKYKNALHLLARAYEYCNYTEKDKMIENSLKYFNKTFNKSLENITKKMVSNGAITFSVSELKQTKYGYYFTINYNDKNIYVNFILEDENQNYNDLDDLSINAHHINFLNSYTIAYDIKVLSKPLKLNESIEFDFNL